MKLYKRAGSDVWYVTAVSPLDGRRLRVSLDTPVRATAQLEAIRLLNKLRSQASHGVGQPQALGEALQVYIEALQRDGKVSWKEAASLRDKLFGFRDAHCVPGARRFSLPAATMLHDLTPMLMERLVSARRGEGNQAQTIAHELKLIRAATRHAVGLGRLGPVQMVRNDIKSPWRVPELPQKTRYLSRREFDMLAVKLSGTKDLALAIALVSTGARWSEIAGLTWAQVSFDRNLIGIWGSKTGQERVVPITRMLQMVLDGLMGVSRCPREADLVFPDATPRAARRIAAAMDVVGLNSPASVERHGRATVHSLRHTCASWLLQGGADLSEVQQTLGHATLDMTRRYAHLAKAKTVSRMAAILDNLEGPAA